METFVAIVHIVVAIILVALVLIQDSKSGSLGGAFGGGGSQSLLGATGAATLAQKLTRWTAVLFAGTCILLSMYAARTHRSIMDGKPLDSTPTPAASAPAAAPANTPTQTEPPSQPEANK
jgi:preprotein translocase subunit SecG